MDPFDPIRSKAAALHEKLVAEGNDSFDPLAIVKAAVRRRDLNLVWLAQGDPALKGRASSIRRSGRSDLLRGGG